MRGRRAACTLLATVVAAGGLVGATIAGPAASAVAAQSPDTFRDTTTVDLLSRGAKPRDRLRLASAAGSTSVGSMRQDVSTKELVSGVEQPSTPVTVTADLRVTVDSVDRDGVRTILFGYENSNITELNGVGGSYIVTDRGFASNGKFTYPPGTDAETQAALEQFAAQIATWTTPFPFAAVGVGARWRVTEHQVVNGLTSTRSVVYALLERDDNRIVLRSKVRQTAPAQTIDATGLPENATATLVSSEGSGAGDVDLDLNEVLPLASTVLGRVAQVIVVEQGTQQIQLDETVTTNLSIKAQSED
jgi:hypothetical protein